MIHRDLNWRLLWSQCLSKQMRGHDAPVKVAEACCGINSQNFQESFSSFWARIDGFRNNDVISKLKPGGGLVRTWAVRSTMHTIPSKDYYVYIFGGASERLLNWIDTIAKKRNYPPREQRQKLLYEPILEEIRGKAVTEQDIRTLVDRKARRFGLREHVWTGLGDMAYLGLLVHAGKRGSSSLWMRSDEWVSSPKKLPDRQTSRIELLRKYIRQHGPVSKDDILYWAYLSRKQLDEALSNMANDLVEVKVKGSKEPHLSLDENMEQDFPPPPKAVVLPKYDSLLLSLKDKSRFMDMAYYKRIFGALGMVRPTVLVDGFIAAAWRKVVKKTTALIEVHSLKRISSSDKKAVEQQFAEYCKYAGFEAPVKWVRSTWIFAPSR